jgi:capsular exopolysaccharide synthesis family protein
MKHKDTDSEEKSFLSPGDILRTARDYWALALVLSAPVAFLYYHVKQKEEPLFSAFSTMMFEVISEDVIAVREVKDTSLSGSGNLQLGMENYLVHLRSQSFIQEVVDSLSESERKRIVDPYITVDDPNPSPAGIIFGGFRVRIAGQGTTVNLETRHRDPEMAAFLADRIADRFSIFVTRRAVNSNDAAISFLMTEAEEFRQKVKESDLALQKYRETHNVLSLGEKQTIVDSRLASVESVVSQANLALVQAEVTWKKAVEAIEAGVPPFKIPSIMAYGDIRESIAAVNRLEGQKELLDLSYGRRHPKMIDIDEQLSIAEDRLKGLIQEALVYLEGQYDAALANYESMNKELEELERESLRIDRLRVDYDDLNGKYLSLKQTYDGIISRLNETTIATKLVQSPVRIVDYASVPSVPTSPNRKKILGASIGLGGAVFCCVVGLVAVLDRRLRSSVSIEGQLGRELLGEVPVLRRFSVAKRYYIVRDNLDVSLRELFQNICGRTELISHGLRPRSILLTSCQPEEGKSLVSTNLAYAFASQGMKAVLVDADIRAPSLDSLFAYEDRAGIGDWYRCQIGSAPADQPHLELSDIIVPVGGGLDMVPAGDAAENPSSVAPTEAFVMLIDQLKARYDIVIIDAPPALLFHDAVSMADLVDQTIVVSRFLKSTISKLTKLFQLLDKTKSRKIGVIFNGVPRSAAQSDYYSKIQYYYGRKRTKHKNKIKAEKEAEKAKSEKVEDLELTASEMEK